MRTWAGFAAGAALAFYDGLFGPGTGAFLLFVRVFGGEILTASASASASAKVVDVGTKLAALAFVAATGQVLRVPGGQMAAANLAGRLTGTGVALARGAGFVRTVFLIVVAAEIANPNRGAPADRGFVAGTLNGRRRKPQVPRETIRTSGARPGARRDADAASTPPHPNGGVTPVAAYIRMRAPPARRQIVPRTKTRS
jgi:hypothetical protein